MDIQKRPLPKSTYTLEYVYLLICFDHIFRFRFLVPVLVKALVLVLSILCSFSLSFWSRVQTLAMFLCSSRSLISFFQLLVRNARTRRALQQNLIK